MADVAISSHVRGGAERGIRYVMCVSQAGQQCCSPQGGWAGTLIIAASETHALGNQEVSLRKNSSTWARIGVGIGERLDSGLDAVRKQG